MDILLISNIEKWHKEVNDKDVCNGASVIDKL